MVNYQNGKIYKIESHLGDKIYIGSTTKQYLSQRMDTHRANYKSWKAGKSCFITSYKVFDEYEIENCKIILLEQVSCNCKDELISREAYYIRSLNCVNKVIPDRTVSEYNKMYQEIHKETITENKKIYQKVHKEKLAQYKKQYRIDNKEIVKNQEKLYRENNKEKITERKSIKMTCDCGSIFRINDKARHERTIKHTNYLETK